MRKSLASRIAILAVLYCVIFCVIVIFQFSNKGNFSFSTTGMTIKGRYSGEEKSKFSRQEITGGIKLFYGGIEFNLREERERSLTLTKSDGSSVHVNPEYMILGEGTASFGLPGGTVLVFNAYESSRGQELIITAELAGNVSEVTIPIIPRRSSLVRDNEQLGIMYNGLRYLFATHGQELQNGRFSLSRETSAVTYRSRGRQRVFDPEEYIITQSQHYISTLASYQSASFGIWNQNAANLLNEDDVIAYCTEAIVRGNYTAAVEAVSRNFLNHPRQTFRSAAFIGGMSNAQRSFIAAENERFNFITRLIREKSLNVLNEKNIIDYLFTRNYNLLAFDIIDIVQNAAAEDINIDHCPGLLEIYIDMKKWRPAAENPIGHLTEQILFIVSENLNRDSSDLVYATNSQGNNPEFSMRLGRALHNWAASEHDTDWDSIGKSLVISALTGAGPGSGHLFNMLETAEYRPRASWLADNGIWAWTVSPNVRTSFTDGNLNLAVSYPAGTSHFMIIRGIRPFIKIQIHDMDWRTDSQFERYDSSGWVYYPQDQILILKLRHRSTVENVRVFYRVEETVPESDEAPNE